VAGGVQEEKTGFGTEKPTSPEKKKSMVLGAGKKFLTLLKGWLEANRRRPRPPDGPTKDTIKKGDLRRKKWRGLF